MESARGWPTSQWRAAVRGAALALPLLTCALLALVRDDVTAASSVLVLVLWVVAAAASGDRIAGILAAVSGAVWFDFFLTEPYQRFTINAADDVEATILLVLIGLAVSEIALWGRRQRLAAERRSGYLDGVLTAAESVVSGNVPAEQVRDLVAQHITDVLGADASRFVAGPVRDGRIWVLDHTGALTRDGHTVDVRRSGLPTDEYTAVPVHRGEHVIGHFLVTSASHVAYPSREQLRVAVLLADQVASVATRDGS
jgi:K+-sensing histidine kinase KdpD